MLFLTLPSSSPVWPLAAFLAICANVGFGASVVAMNAYLPTLAREDREVVNALENLRAAEADISEPVQGDGGSYNSSDSDGVAETAAEPLLSGERTYNPHLVDASPEMKELRSEYTSILSQTTSRISSTGIALGYFSGIAALIIALIPVTKLGGSTFALRLAIGMSGAWWALFTIPAWAWLPGSGGEGSGKKQSEHIWILRNEIWKAWKRVGQMLRWREIKRLRNTFWFLGAWFLLSDGKFSSFTPALNYMKDNVQDLRPSHQPRSFLARRHYICRLRPSSLSEFSSMYLAFSAP